jgi:hypothetical protein
MQIDARVLQAAREGDVLAKALSAVVGEVRSVKDVVLGNSKQTRRPDHPFFKQLTFVEKAALMCSAVKVVMDRSGCVTLTLPEGMPFHGVSAAMVADYAHECGVQFEHNWGKRTE